MALNRLFSRVLFYPNDLKDVSAVSYIYGLLIAAMVYTEGITLSLLVLLVVFWMFSIFALKFYNDFLRIVLRGGAISIIEEWGVSEGISYDDLVEINESVSESDYPIHEGDQIIRDRMREKRDEVEYEEHESDIDYET